MVFFFNILFIFSLFSFSLIHFCFSSSKYSFNSSYLFCLLYVPLLRYSSSNSTSVFFAFVYLLFVYSNINSLPSAGISFFCFFFFIIIFKFRLLLPPPFSHPYLCSILESSKEYFGYESLDSAFQKRKSRRLVLNPQNSKNKKAIIIIIIHIICGTSLVVCSTHSTSFTPSRSRAFPSVLPLYVNTRSSRDLGTNYRPCVALLDHYYFFRLVLCMCVCVILFV